jgi:hypothetical protein
LKFVDEFLGVRAHWDFVSAGGRAAPRLRLSCGRKQPLLVTVLAYLMIVAGLFWSRCRIARDQFLESIPKPGTPGDSFRARICLRRRFCLRLCRPIEPDLVIPRRRAWADFLLTSARRSNCCGKHFPSRISNLGYQHIVRLAELGGTRTPRAPSSRPPGQLLTRDGELGPPSGGNIFAALSADRQLSLRSREIFARNLWRAGVRNLIRLAQDQPYQEHRDATTWRGRSSDPGAFYPWMTRRGLDSAYRTAQ